LITTKKLGQKKPTKKTQNYNLDLSSQRGHAKLARIALSVFSEV
jgi:hypothetical protein